MKLYHTATQEDYDDLMIELEEKGITWSGGSKPTSINNWQRTGSNTCISLNNRVIEYCDTSYYNHNYPFIEIIEYKAKGDKQMLNTECKQYHRKWHYTNAKYCSMCGKKLVDEPKFKVGDYAVELGKYITKIEKISEYGIPVGAFYELENNRFCKSGSTVASYEARHATPEEIAEYESALNFHEHGRKPFVIKNGDLVANGDGISHIVENAHNNKELFLLNNLKLLATSEELEKWLGTADE